MAHFLNRPGFLLARVDQIATAIYAGFADGETLAQAELLLLLDATGAVPQIGLAQAAGIDKSTAGYILDNLQARDWIARIPCEADRRKTRVSLTGDGVSQVDRIRNRFAELQRQLTSAIDEAEIAHLRSRLRRLGSNPMSPAPLWLPAFDPAVGVLDRAISFLVRRLLQVLQAQFVACTPTLNLTLRQFSLLFVLAKRSSISQVGFARMFGIDPSTCAVILRGLLARDLVIGQPSLEDRRARVYAITEQGREALAEIHPLVDRSERMVFRGEPAAGIRSLVHALRGIVREHSDRLRFPGALDEL